jgi:hypothetical protein
METTGTVVSRSHEYAAGCPVFPAASVALTSKVWLPSVSPVSTRGEVQLWKPDSREESSRHSKVDPGSLETKVKVLELAELTAGSGLGSPVIVAVGAVPSMLQV